MTLKISYVGQAVVNGPNTMIWNTYMNRVAARLGYRPIDQGPVPPLVRLPPAPSLPPHLAHEAEFDYSKAANSKDWTFFYSTDEGGFHYSIGRRDWMPVLLAGFCIGVNNRDGLSLFSSAIAERLWLTADAPSHKSWIESNLDMFNQLEALEYRPETDEAAATEFSPSMFSNMTAGTVSMELKAMWRRAMPFRPEVLLATTHVHSLLCKQPFMSDAVNAPQTALNRLLDLTSEWFVARGMSVDREEMLVKVDGYEPLVYIDTDPDSY